MTTSEDFELVHYCIVRADLPRGVLAAQLIHAAGESSPGALPRGTKAVALAARDQYALERVALKLRRLGLPHHPIHEPDAPWNGALMAIGIPPVTRPPTTRAGVALRRVLRRLPLLLSPQPNESTHTTVTEREGQS